MQYLARFTGPDSDLSPRGMLADALGVAALGVTTVTILWLPAILSA